jgi:hypothetical protein
MKRNKRMTTDEAAWIAERHALIAHFTRLMVAPGADVAHLKRKRGRERAFLTLGYEGTRNAAAAGWETRLGTRRRFG